MPEIRRIARHRHIPKHVKKSGEVKAEEIKSIKRKEQNRRKNSKKDNLPKARGEREKMLLTVEQ